jgi:hypothetical protein
MFNVSNRPSRSTEIWDELVHFSRMAFIRLDLRKREPGRVARTELATSPVLLTEI